MFIEPKGNPGLYAISQYLITGTLEIPREPNED
jgi:hypothetical protein